MALIASQRHSAEDLAHWATLERMDRINGERISRGDRPRRAADAIARFHELGECYFGTSWGKDSVVALHLMVTSGVSVPVVHVVQEGPQKDPDQHRVRDDFLARFAVDYHEIAVADAGQEDGKVTRALQVGVREARRRFGHRWISGLRADESTVRKRAAMRRMESSCWPIAWWSADDVFGYLEHHDLPIHPAYACTQGGFWDRRHIRVSILGGKKGTGWGRREWEWHYYPNEMRQLFLSGVVGPRGSGR